MTKRTSLYEQHQQAGAQLVDFAGWEMPLHYGSQMKEHQWVREAVGMFDVSHMGVVDLSGAGTKDFLRYALANDVEKLKTPGKALYSCMLNESGGVVDDLIVYYLAENKIPRGKPRGSRCTNNYRLVLNAGTRDTDIQWLKSLSKDFDVVIKERPELSIVALQGPASLELLASMLDDPLSEQLKTLKPFTFFVDQEVMIARTGYTGEDGVEMIVPNDMAPAIWRDLFNEEVKPCGLGARDTLRLEAGYNLYGADMDAKTSPLVSNLSWTVSFKDTSRHFVGREALEKEKAAGVQQKLVGLVMKDPGVLRNHQTVFIDGVGEGEITSGSFSPTLHHAIALARVPVETGNTAEVERRGKRIAVEVVKPPFYTKQTKEN